MTLLRRTDTWLTLNWQTSRGAALLCLAGSVLVFALYYGILKGDHPTLLSDSYEYAQAARNLVQGRGLTTQTATVLEFSLLGRWGLPLPYFFHDVGNTLLLAVFFKLFGVADRVIGWMSGAFYVLIPPLVALLGGRLFRPRVGLIAGILCIAAPQLIVFGTTGYSETPYAFFLTLVLFLVYTQRQGWGIFLAGLVFGWLIILRSNSLPFLPWLFIYIGADQLAAAKERGLQRWDQTWRGVFIACLAFLVGMLIFAVPNAVRNHSYLGSPLYNVNSIYSPVWYTSAIEGKSSSVFATTGLDLNPLMFILQNPGELINKMYFQLARVFPDLFNGGIIQTNNWLDLLLILLFVVSILAPPRDEPARHKRLRYLVYTLIATAFVFGSLFNLRWRHLYGFIPILLLYDAEFIVRNATPLLNILHSTPDAAQPALQLAMRRVLAVVLVLIALGISPIVDNLRPADTLTINGFYIDLARFISENVPADAVILTDAGTSTLQAQNGLAWYSRRQFVQFAPATFAVMEKSRTPLFLLLTKDPLADETVAPNAPAPGFTRVGVWRQGFGNVAAVLFKRE